MEENQAEPSATQGDEQDAVATDPVVENWLEVGSRADKLAEFCDKTFDDDFLTTLDALFYLACANLKGIGISADELHEAVDAVFAANIPEVHALLPKLNGTGK